MHRHRVSYTAIDQNNEMEKTHNEESAATISHIRNREIDYVSVFKYLGTLVTDTNCDWMMDGNHLDFEESY